MAGITDLPQRNAARRWGAALAYSEMLTSQTTLWESKKSQSRLPQLQDPLPRPVQIAGYDAQMLADAAAACEQLGAGMIDINMGCPAKKVCKRAAGSALLQDEPLVEQILNAVVKAVSVPVTLKTRTGISPEEKNGMRIAQIAEQAGIAALSIHGRTRACRFKGQAEYDSIAQIAQSLSIPVIANGDIQSPEQAKKVLSDTGAAAVMIGRGALGQPWIFQQVRDFLQTGTYSSKLELTDRFDTMQEHLSGIHSLYEGIQGVRIARKHIGWYLDVLCADSQPINNQPVGDQSTDSPSTEHQPIQSKVLKSVFNQLETSESQLAFLNDLRSNLINTSGEIVPPSQNQLAA